MRCTIASLLLAAALLVSRPATGASVVSVNIASSEGTTLSLQAGTWRIELGGAEAWNSTGGLVSVCDPSGSRCKKGWTTHFGIDLGYGISRFDRIEGLYLGMDTPGYAASLFASPAQALTAGQTGPVFAAPLEQLYRFEAWNPLGGPVLLDLPEAQPVNFFVADEEYADNVGGLALLITPLSPVPEPSGWLLLMAGVATLAAQMRRRARGPYPPRVTGISAPVIARA